MASPLYDKAALFADRILDMSDYLLTPKEQIEEVSVNGKTYNKTIKIYPKYSIEVCVKQITRSGTSIVANIAEGQGVQSRADLTAKLSIAYKEALETECWLERLKNRNVLDESVLNSINDDLQEILRLLISSLNTLTTKK